MTNNPLEIPRKRVWLVLAAVLLLLVAAIGTEVLFRWAGGDDSVEPRTMAEYRPPMAPKAPSAALSLEELLRVFSAAASAPAAQRFAAGFRGQKSLMRLWKDFEGNRDLQAFVRGLRTSPEFSTLLRRFAPEPGFREAAEQVAAYPPVTQAIRELLSVESLSRPRSSILVVPPPSGDDREAAFARTTRLAEVPVVGAAVDARGYDPPSSAAPEHKTAGAAVAGKSGGGKPAPGCRGAGCVPAPPTNPCPGPNCPFLPPGPSTAAPRGTQ